MNIAFLHKFNNYYNRKVKKYSDLDDYLAYEYSIRDRVNFNQSDGVMTSLTVNWDMEWSPDYFVVFNDYNEIVSRWFVIESV